MVAAAEVYETFFVPALFSQWVEPVLDAAGVGFGDRVLDVGCGTGIVARGAADRTGATGEVVGLDRNEGMLTVARRTPGVTWRQGRAEDLPFVDGAFDRVLSQFVLMFVDDRHQTVREMARVLKPGGTVAVATWAAVGRSPGYTTMVDLLRRVVDEEAAQALLAPFCLGTEEAVADLMATAFPEVRVTPLAGTARFDSIEAWVHTEIRGWTLADRIDETTYAHLLAEATTALAAHADADGRVTFPTPAIIATATSPG